MVTQNINKNGNMTNIIDTISLSLINDLYLHKIIK